MPRYGSKTRTSITEKDSKYNLNYSFKSYDKAYKYNAQDSLVFWGNLCNPKPSAGSYAVIPGQTLVGSDMSISNSASSHLHGAYTPDTVSMTRLTTQEFCGEKCYFLFEGPNVTIPSPGSGLSYLSPQMFVYYNHPDLNFYSGGNDRKFSISFWVRSGHPNTGGTLASGAPASFYFSKPLHRPLFPA